MRLLVFGASGGTGTHLVTQALAEGHQVSAFVRAAGSISIRHPRLSVVQGNVADAAAVRHAVAGHDAIISALGAHSIFQFDSIVVNGVGHIVKAMAELGVRRFIYLSTLGVRASRPKAGVLTRILAPTLLRNEIRGHELREQIILDSGLDWTIVRAPILTNGGLTKSYPAEHETASARFAPKLSRADVAHSMLGLLTQSRFTQKAVGLLHA